jgi:TPR repeat protein
MVAQTLSFVRVPRRAPLALMVAMMSLLAVPAFAASELSRECAQSLEQARLWIRATDPQAPNEEKAKVRAAAEKANAVCTSARKAEPKNGEVLVNAAYALFAMGETLEGVKLIEKAAEGGYPPAMVMTARYLGRGEHLEKDAEGAWMMLIQTLKSDNAAARIQAALEFMPGGVGPESPKRTRKVLQEMIAAGNGEAMVSYAMKVLGLRKADAGSVEAKEGIKLLERAASEAKDGTALIFLSLLYNQGTMVERDEAKAVEYAQAAIDAGINRAYATMGQIYQNQGDMRTAVKWFRKGAETGDGFSQSMLGFAYSGGFGIEQNMDKAVEWWTKGRWNGDRLASSYLQVHREKMRAKAAWEKKQAKKASEESNAKGTAEKPKKSE